MLLYGKPVVEALREQQTARVTAGKVRPRLEILQAGNDLASTTYIKMKKRYGESIGATVDHLTHSEPNSAAKLLETIHRLNNDPTTHGIIVQLPIPEAAATDEIVSAIAPAKDVDGLSPHSRFHSATAMAVLQLLKYYDVTLDSTSIVVVGHGRLVGAPLARLLKDRGLAVTVCDKYTTNLPAHTRKADVIISATGVGGLIKPDMIKDGTTIVDVGTAEDDGAIVGDVDPALLENPTLRITPAKGGIGPVTVAMLFEQLLEAAKL